MKSSTLREVLALPVPARLRLAREILESVTEEKTLTKREKAIPDKRIEEDERNPDEGQTWAEVKRTLRRAKR